MEVRIGARANREQVQKDVRSGLQPMLQPQCNWEVYVHIAQSNSDMLSAQTGKLFVSLLRCK